MIRPSRGSFFDPDMPQPAKPYDNQPPGPVKRMCPVCGLKYLPAPGKDSPCDHVKKDGTLQP